MQDLTPAVVDAFAHAVMAAGRLVLENFVEPKVMGRTLDIHPLIVLVVTALGGLIGGIVGLNLAVPATADRRERVLPPPIRRVHRQDGRSSQTDCETGSWVTRPALVDRRVSGRCVQEPVGNGSMPQTSIPIPTKYDCTQSAIVAAEDRCRPIDRRTDEDGRAGIGSRWRSPLPHNDICCGLFGHRPRRHPTQTVHRSATTFCGGRSAVRMVDALGWVDGCGRRTAGSCRIHPARSTRRCSRSRRLSRPRPAIHRVVRSASSLDRCTLTDRDRPLSQVGQSSGRG